MSLPLSRQIFSFTRPLARYASSTSGPSTRYSAVTHPDNVSPIPPVLAAELEKAQMYTLPVYARPPLVLVRGKKSKVWDSLGREYIDFMGGVAVNALGHADDGIVETLQKEAATLSHSSNVYYNKWAAELAELIVKSTQREGGLGYARGTTNPAHGAKIFFSNTGTEANEGALKVARKVGKDRWAAAAAGRTWSDKECNKWRIVCFENAFHGRSMGSLSITPNPKYQAPFAPLVPGIDVGKVNDIDGLSSLVTEETCAVIIEPIQGEGGIHLVREEWLRALRKRCDETGAVLIYDEIQCGLYRTGDLWAHSSLPVDCHPDIVTMAKPLGNGYPIGAVLMRDSVAATMTPGTHGTTFGGSPLACALGHHVLTRLSAPGFSEQVRAVSSHLFSRLSKLPGWFPEIIQDEGIRGRGLMVGIGFRDASHPGEVVKLARERGLLILTAGKDAVRLVPSLTINKSDVDFAADVVESSLVELARQR